jgi:hypothetical protein
MNYRATPTSRPPDRRSADRCRPRTLRISGKLANARETYGTAVALRLVTAPSAWAGPVLTPEASSLTSTMSPVLTAPAPLRTKLHVVTTRLHEVEALLRQAKAENETLLGELVQLRRKQNRAGAT